MCACLSEQTVAGTRGCTLHAPSKHRRRHAWMWIENRPAADAESDWEVQSLFDDIEYQKGGSVLRMLWDYMSSSYYASSRLPAGAQPGHDDNVSLRLAHLCLHTLPLSPSMTVHRLNAHRSTEASGQQSPTEEVDLSQKLLEILLGFPDTSPDVGAS